jgi:peptide/nickel transport system substrate-binding protein
VGRNAKALMLAAVLSAAAGACGGDNDEGSTGTTTAPTSGAATSAAATSGAATSGAPPSTTAAAGEGCTAARKGGSVTMGTLTPIAGLDPTIALGSGSAGGIELSALYDTLLRYVPSTGEYVPHVAESVTANADLTQWTVKLRPNVKFGNGDPLTTDAVKFSFERMQKARVSSAGLAAEVASMTIVDPLTMTFALKSPFGQFPYVLAEDTGGIVNPNVVNAKGAEAFNLDPTGGGVGPYELVRYAPNEEIALKAKTDYWGGPVCIENLRFVYIRGGQGTYDAFRNGELQMAFISEPKVVADAKAAGVKGYENIANGANYLVLNNGVRGTTSPLSDIRIRQAVAAAIDVNIINQRVDSGAGLPSSALIWKDDPLYPGVPGPVYDPERAKQLVTEAKAAGWDGKLRLVGQDTPAAIEQAITVEAMLEAVGMDISVESLPTNEANARVLTNPDFDLGFSGLSIFEDSPWARLNQFETGNVRSRTGYSNPEMDAALTELKSAVTREQKRAALGKIQKVWNETVPSTVLTTRTEFVATDDSVKGLVYSRDTVPMFYDAYLQN